nr:MAG TPA: hypothetical protein [Caudoviricetes sp.]
MKVKEFIKMYDMKNIQEVYIYQWNSRREAVDNIPYAPSMEYVTLLSDNNFNYELPKIDEFITNIYELTPSEDDYIDGLSSYDEIEELENIAMHEEKTILYIVLPYGKKFKNDYE